MCERQKRTLSKPFELLMQVVLFNELLYFASTMVHHESISIKHIIGRLIPANWFVILYITIYLISPFLNMVICKMESPEKFEKFVRLLVLLFSVYPTLVDILCVVTHKEFLGLSSIGMYGSQWGYTIVNFSVMYVIGAYLRKQSDNVCVKKHVIRFLTLAIVLTVWAIIGSKFNVDTGRNAWEYCNPLVILMAIEAFQIFRKINIGCNRVINHFAKASFTVYLLHAYLFRFLSIPQFVTKSAVVMILHMMICVSLIYLICSLVHEIYNKMTAPIFEMLFEKTVFKRELF